MKHLFAGLMFQELKMCHPMESKRDEPMQNSWMNANFIQSKIRIGWKKGQCLTDGIDKVSGDKSPGFADWTFLFQCIPPRYMKYFTRSFFTIYNKRQLFHTRELTPASFLKTHEHLFTPIRHEESTEACLVCTTVANGRIWHQDRVSRRAWKYENMLVWNIALQNNSWPWEEGCVAEKRYLEVPGFPWFYFFQGFTINKANFFFFLEGSTQPQFPSHPPALKLFWTF